MSKPNYSWATRHTEIKQGRAICSLSAEQIDAQLSYYDCAGGEDDLNVYELAKYYYPRMWDKSRLEALVKAGRLTEEEYREIVGEEKE